MAVAGCFTARNSRSIIARSLTRPEVIKDLSRPKKAAYRMGTPVCIHELEERTPSAIMEIRGVLHFHPGVTKFFAPCCAIHDTIFSTASPIQTQSFYYNGNIFRQQRIFR